MQNQLITSLDRFRAQMKAFREDEETQWKYREKEWQRQRRILKDAGGSDEQFKETLKKAGINVSALEAEWKNEIKKQKRVFEELRKIEAPPRKQGQKERLLLDQGIFRPPLEINTLIYPPAQDSWGSTEDCGLNLALGEINVKGEATGDGWGWEASASPPPATCSLWFYYFPPRAGELTVEPHVEFEGDVALYAHDHWYTSTWADLEMKLSFDLFQYYWDGEVTTTIFDVRTQNINTAFWVDDHRVLSKSMSVAAHDPVWIKLTVSHQCDAHSSDAHVSYDFRTGSDRRIRVEYIRIHMPGERIVAFPF